MDGPKEIQDKAEARLHRAQRAAADGAAAMADHHAEARAVAERTARLKALRLAKEAAETEALRTAAPPQAEAKPARKKAVRGA